MRKSIFNWNHISDKLTEDQIKELKALYKNYHRLFKCYEWKYKKLKRLKLSLEMTSISLVTIGGIVGAVTANPIILGCISGPGVLIQGYLTKSNLINNVERCKFAYTTYKKILVQLKSFLRGLEYDDVMLLSDLKILDDIIIDQCPCIDNYFDKYNSKFTE